LGNKRTAGDEQDEKKKGNGKGQRRKGDEKAKTTMHYLAISTLPPNTY